MPSWSPPFARSALRLRLLGLCLIVFANAAQAQLALPIQETSVTIDSSGPLVLPIDLGTIPNRPDLVVDVTPTDPAVELEIEVSGWGGLGACVAPGQGTWSGSTPTFVSDPAVGANSLVVKLRNCEPRVPSGFWDDGSVDVTIRVIEFAGTTQEADVDVWIRGVTVIPTEEPLIVVETMPPLETSTFFVDRDTVLYQAGTTLSNGTGDFLWAGVDYRLIGQPPLLIPIWQRLNSLLAVDDLLVDLPPGTLVTDAYLDLVATSVLGGGGFVTIYDIESAASGERWLEGSANAPGSEFAGTVSSTPAADWIHRRGDEDAWLEPGGDLVTPALSSLSVTTTGQQIFDGPGIADSIQAVVDDRSAHEGFLIRGPSGALGSTDVAIQFASRSNPEFGDRPRLVVEFQPPPNAGGQFTTGTVTFIGEGQNFRWIYDTDGDDLLYTDIGGVCEALDQAFPDGTVAPYNYAYQGPPDFEGTDCCAWQIDAPNTGVIGTGQAIFFIGLDPNLPGSLPPDTDGDGMRDGCDNCVNVPNGPLLGTCLGLAGPGALCNADTDCGQYEFCSLSQEDVDLDEAGDACSVPEPGFATMLGVAVMGMAGLGRRRRR